MSYCMRCGKQTDNEDFVCDECRRKDSAVSGAAVQGAAASYCLRRVCAAGGVYPRMSSFLPELCIFGQMLTDLPASCIMETERAAPFAAM